MIFSLKLVLRLGILQLWCWISLMEPELSGPWCLVDGEAFRSCHNCSMVWERGFKALAPENGLPLPTHLSGLLWGLGDPGPAIRMRNGVAPYSTPSRVNCSGAVAQWPFGGQWG
jgi:hypothetical protein